MRIRNLIKVATEAVYANKTRSLLTSLGIIIGVTSVILLVSIGTGIKVYITGAFEDLGSDLLMVMPGRTGFGGNRGGREGGPPGAATNKLTLKIVDAMSKQFNGEIKTAPVLTTSGVAKYRANTIDTSVVGTDANYTQVRNTPLTEGRFFNEGEVGRRAKVAVIGTTIVEELYAQENPIGQEINFSDDRYRIIGVLESKGSGLGNDQDNQIIVPVTTIQQQLGLDKVSYVYVKVNDKDNIDIISSKLTNYLRDRQNLTEDEFTVVSSEELLTTINGVLTTVTLALSGIAAISLLVGGIGIMNIMLVSVTERTREIGLRKAVGARPADILIQFLVEAVILSLTGGVIGIILGALGSLALSQFIQTSVTWWSIGLAFGFSTLVGVVFGVWPARRASKLSPIEALRYE